MTRDRLSRLTMPKWGLTMTQGLVTRWLVDEGDEVAAGDEIVEIETEKIASAAEAPAAGVMRRRVAREGDQVPVAGLLGVIAGREVPDEEIDEFVESFLGSFVPDQATEEGPVPQTVDLTGHALRYLRHGDGGEPIVLLHGFGGDLNNWLFNHEALAAERAVYAIDLPGHGGSSKDVSGGGVGVLADSVAGLASALGMSRVHLVGHSLGGAVALEAALSHPGLVGSITLVASAGLGSEINFNYVNGFIESARRRQLKPYLEELFGDPSLVTRQLVDDVLKFKRLDGVDGALRAIAASFISNGEQTLTYRDALDHLDAPVQVIWGTEDRIIPASHADGLHEHVAVHRIEGAGHMAMMEAPSEVNRAIAGFTT